MVAVLSVADIIQIEKHLATPPQVTFDNYNKIAANADNDSDIDTMDINAIRKIILGLTTTFPAPSWRFIMDKDKSSFQSATFLNAYNYLVDNGYEISNVTATQITNANWIVRAIKVGDLNGSHPEIRASISPAQVSTNAILAGEEVELIFHVKNFNDIQGYQFGMHLDPAYVDILSIEQGDLEGFSLDNFGDHTKERGELRAMWYSKNAKNVSLGEKDVIFKLKVKAVQPVNNLQSVLQVRDAILPMEFIANGSLATDAALEVKVVRGNVVASNQELKVYPNPATDVSSVGFNLEEPAQVNLAIYDASGKLIKIYREQFSKGYNEFLLDHLTTLPSGLLLLKLETASWSAQSKLVTGLSQAKNFEF